MSCQSTGTLAVMNPDTPPITNSRIIEEKNRNAVVITGRPSQMVAIQANTATAEGTTMTMRRAGEERHPEARQSGGEHVMHPHAEAQNHGRHGAKRHQRVAHQRPAAEYRQPVRHHAHGG